MVACSSRWVIREPHQMRSNRWGKDKSPRFVLDKNAVTAKARRQNSKAAVSISPTSNLRIREHCSQEPEDSSVSAWKVENSPDCPFFASGAQGPLNAAAGRESDRKVAEGFARPRHVHFVCTVDLKRDLVEKAFLLICEIP